MKKFLIYLVVILVAVSVGFTVFYLVRDNETISISTSNIYMRDGDKIDDLEIIYENKKSFSDYEVISSDESIASYDKEKGLLTAHSGGVATITFRTSNEKFRNLSCQVYVGDGSITSPYYIRSAEDLREIGASVKDGAVPKFTLDKCYKLINNINLAEGFTGTGYWIPIGAGAAGGFTGNFDGNGYTISNININKAAYIDSVSTLENFEPEIGGYATYIDAGLFSKIGKGGRVCNLKINNFNLEGSYTDGSNLGNVGTVAGVNEGTIERIEIISSNICATNVSTIGGVVGSNLSTEETIDGEDELGQELHEYVRHTARVDRVAANVNLGVIAGQPGEITGASKIVGGLVGKNHGGIVIYSYSTGDVHLNSQTTMYGGIVGYNTFKTFENTSDSYQYDYVGAHIKDSYSVMKLRKVNPIPGAAYIGAVVGYNQDKAPLDLDVNEGVGSDDAGFVNKVIGNYYLTTAVNYVEENDSVVNSGQGSQTTYIGCGKYQFDGQDAAYEDSKYVIQGRNETQLKERNTFKSHEETEQVQNLATGEYIANTRVIAWKFDTIWSFNKDLNNGYPILNFANIEVSDELFTITDGTTIKTVTELQNMKLDGHYVIAADITFGANDIWIPIGTIQKPFTGSLKAAAYYDNGSNKQYYRIYNIKTSASTNLDEIDAESETLLPHAGLFGVVSGTAGCRIENITLVNPTFANGEIVGGIAACNGFSSSATGKATITKGASIENCHIVSGTLRGSKATGGIAGENYGAIDNCSVSEVFSNLSGSAKTSINLKATSNGYVGGIAGLNMGSVVTSKVLEATTIFAESEHSLTVSVGGAVGNNKGSIINVMVIDAEITISGMKGSIGGLAGDNYSEIKNSISKSEISASTDKETYAGGVAGYVGGQSAISNCLVAGGSVAGKYAGGIAGYMNYTKDGGGVYSFKVIDSAPGYSLGGDDKDTVYGCGVNAGFAVKGVMVGGFVGTIDNGIIRHSYTQASLQGASGDAVKGGFAADLNLNKNSGELGIIISCYTYCSFDGNGSNHSITQDKILQDPALGKDKVFGVDVSRSAGYCFNYAYVREKDGASDPVMDDDFLNLLGKAWNGIVGWFDKESDNNALLDPCGVNTVNKLKGSDKIADFLVNKDMNTTNGWKHNKDALPTRSELDGLESSINSTYARIRKVTIPSKVTVLRNNKPLVNGAEVTEGDVLLVSYTTTEKHSVKTFTINGKEMLNNCKFVVGDEDVVIVYTEKLTHYDVEIKASQNGSVSVGQGVTYLKENTSVQIFVTPDTNFVLDKITVKDADGTEIAVAADNTFVMPSKNITIEATFKATYALTIPERVTLTNANNDAVASGSRACAGEVLTVTVNPEEGYVIKPDSLKVKTVEDTPVEVALDANNKFTMPDKDVVIEVEFLRLGTITKAANVALKDGAAADLTGQVLEGTEVTIVVTPETNYIVDVISVSTTSGASIEVVDGKFIMPNEDVTIDVTYKLTYALTIPTGVTVKKGDKVLTASDRVVAGDELTITYTLTSGYELKTFTVNGGTITDNKFVVGSADVVIVFEEQLTYGFTITETLADQHSVSVIRQRDGLNIVDTTERLVAGDVLTISYVVPTGYTLVSFTVNGVDFTSGSTYTVTDSNVDIQLTYAQ